MHPLLNIALQAARQAEKYLIRAFNDFPPKNIKAKGRNDFVTEVDQALEQIIIDVILKNYPNHSILAEESGHLPGNGPDQDYQWIIDPLDGTTNFIFGYPHFAISIALMHNEQPLHAVILDPIKREEFTASKGAGAQLNGRRIRVSNRRSLEGALLGTGIPFQSTQLPYLDSYMHMLKQLIPKTIGIRRAGAATLDLAYVAAGRLDGFWEFGLKPWDIAAGILLIQEAGGLVGDFFGQYQYFQNQQIVCGNPKIFKAILQTIQPHIQQWRK